MNINISVQDLTPKEMLAIGAVILTIVLGLVFIGSINYKKEEYKKVEINATK